MRIAPALAQRRVIHEPEATPHEFGKGAFVTILGVAAEQCGIIRHGGFLLTAAARKTEQSFSGRRIFFDRRNSAPERFE
jgi:hypothetical protein